MQQPETEDYDIQVNVKLIRKGPLLRTRWLLIFAKPEGFQFRAGQFTDCTLLNPPESDAEGGARGLSWVQAPFEPDLDVAPRMRDVLITWLSGSPCRA